MKMLEITCKDCKTSIQKDVGIYSENIKTFCPETRQCGNVKWAVTPTCFKGKGINWRNYGLPVIPEEEDALERTIEEVVPIPKEMVRLQNMITGDLYEGSGRYSELDMDDVKCFVTAADKLREMYDELPTFYYNWNSGDYTTSLEEAEEWMYADDQVFHVNRRMLIEYYCDRGLINYL